MAGGFKNPDPTSRRTAARASAEDDEGEVLDSYNRIKSSTKEQEKYIKFYLFEEYNKVIGFAKEVAERFASKKNNSNSSEQRENDETMAKTHES